MHVRSVPVLTHFVAWPYMCAETKINELIRYAVRYSDNFTQLPFCGQISQTSVAVVPEMRTSSFVLLCGLGVLRVPHRVHELIECGLNYYDDFTKHPFNREQAAELGSFVRQTLLELVHEQGERFEGAEVKYEICGGYRRGKEQVSLRSCGVYIRGKER